MAFQSGVAAEGSGPHVALTWVVALVLVSCVALFVLLLAVELYRSYRFARRVVHAVRKASASAKRRLSRVGSVVSLPLAPGGGVQATGSLSIDAGAAKASRVPASAAWVSNPLRTTGPQALSPGPPPPPPPPATMPPLCAGTSPAGSVGKVPVGSGVSGSSSGSGTGSGSQRALEHKDSDQALRVQRMQSR
jgi:hypothetical protein